MRSTSRMADVSINTVAKLLADAGRACAEHHDKAVRGVKARRMFVARGVPAHVRSDQGPESWPGR